MNSMHVFNLNAQFYELYVCLLVNPVRMYVTINKDLKKLLENYKDLNIEDRLETTTP
jgi:hypothetical protein